MEARHRHAPRVYPSLPPTRSSSRLPESPLLRLAQPGRKSKTPAHLCSLGLESSSIGSLNSSAFAGLSALPKTDAPDRPLYSRTSLNAMPIVLQPSSVVKCERIKSMARCRTAFARKPTGAALGPLFTLSVPFPLVGQKLQARQSTPPTTSSLEKPPCTTAETLNSGSKANRKAVRGSFNLA